MKAVVRSKYGPPTVLSIKEVETPVQKDDEVLIKIHATTVNRTDCGILWGKPGILRLFTGLFRPKLGTTGTDFAGEIVAAGKNVQSFKVGDKVMGFNGMVGCGSHAQYITMRETDGIVTMPANLSYKQAVACLEGAFYAASGIKKLQPRPGQKALVNGATGAIGSSAVQILKFYNVSITAVCKAENDMLVKLLGAEKTIDYTTHDFTSDTDKYDFIFDSAGKSTFAKCKPLLKEKGVYAPADGLINFWFAFTTSFSKGKKVMFGAPANVKDGLLFIKTLVEQGHFKPLIDRTYSFDKIPEAYKYVATGQKIGNVVITMDT
ncbi:MAG TPA: NAD(P)-dependent alcohol dehydrogenase [Chitinophagaceae bacterium]|nr:NAD(P)-dependent alcohol dehydrogenase [Chitinophagaceae bacterium]